MRAESVTFGDRAQPLAAYPHLRRANGFVFLSGTSARRPDGSVVGAARGPAGERALDIRAQTGAVIDHLEALLRGVGADLTHLVEVTTFLVDMADYAGYNEVWNQRFDPRTAPARTTVGVRSLPGPDLLIEMRAVAIDPRAGSAG